MFYIILGVGVVVVVAVTFMNRGEKSADPALDAARRVRDHVHLTDDGNQHGSFEKSGGTHPDGGNFSTAEGKISGGENFSSASEESVRKNFTADLVWSGKGSRLEAGGILLPGAMTYWSNGPAQVKEPCCIDITLPVKFDENVGMPEISSAYQTMSPEQRGAYLRWLSRGRMGALSPSYFRTWFFGIERRAMFDKKDSPMCLGEISSRLPSLLENPSLPVILRFLTCVAVANKYPTDRLALDLRHVPSLSAEILNVLLAPYSDSEVYLPPLIAYTVMRNAFPGSAPVLHNEEQLMIFTAAYRDGMELGMSLSKPKAMSFVAYFPSNPSLSGPKPLASIETPDFFKDPSQFAQLLSIWEQVRNTRLNKPTKQKIKRRLPEKKEEIPDTDDGATAGAPELVSLDKEMRGDIDAFIEEKLHDGEEQLIIPLLELAELIDMDLGERPMGEQRRGLCDITRTGGRLLVPDLGLSGKLYQWENLTSLVWIEIGERVSDSYRVAAILSEFSMSLMSKIFEKKKNFADIAEKITLHIKLTEEEQERLSLLSKICERQPIEPESFADSFQNYLHDEDKILLRDFIFRLCISNDANARERDEFTSRLAEILQVEGRPQPIANTPPDEVGELLKTSLTRLFRSEELKNG